jgi:hypothetical protein
MTILNLRKLLVLVVAALGLFFGQGCIPHWQVVKQATPNPLVGQNKFVLEEPSFEGLMVQDRPEAEFKAGRNAEENQRWDDDKKKVADTIIGKIREETHYDWLKEPSADAILVRTKITNMHGGISMGIGSTASRIAVTVQLVKGSDVLDEITTEGSYSQGESMKIGGISTGGYSGSDRLGKAADRVGGYVADYLESRTKP